MIRVNEYGEVYDDFESDFWFEDLLDKEEMKLNEKCTNKRTENEVAEASEQCLNQGKKRPQSF